MAKTEKIFYILEQVRLCLDRKDYIRCVSSACKVAPSAGTTILLLQCTLTPQRELAPSQACPGGIEMLAMKDSAQVYV